MSTQLPAAKDFDKLGEHLFSVKVTNLQIGEFREVTGLSVEREVMEYAEAGNNDYVYKLPGRLKFPNLVLKRGATNQQDLLKWFNTVRTSQQLETVTLTLVDPTGTTAQLWAFKDAYPVKWTGPNFNAGSDAGATETLEIAHGGWAEI